MTDFQIFFTEGFNHITDLKGIDHIAFIAALTSVYVVRDVKKLLILITAFTIGHSITLALSSFDIFSLYRNVTEFLIALTILFTAAYNLLSIWQAYKNKKALQGMAYPLALLFGLIHGLGFSSYLKSMFGKDESIWVQLLSFNIGLEVGQILIVAFLLVLSFIFVGALKTSQILYVSSINFAVLIVGLQMCLQRTPF